MKCSHYGQIRVKLGKSLEGKVKSRGDRLLPSFEPALVPPQQHRKRS
ncbi:MAG: hypothetical protein F6J93_26285 [Oscillatoria sp. SIO1A7]|nr:hypothetical protein [Oscillatoria sp. SIO1A7]